MDAIFLLADHAAVAEGKLYMNGAGWTLTDATTPPMGLALLFEVPWDGTNKPVTFTLALVDEDGQAVMQPGLVGEAPVEIQGDFEVGRPVGAKHGAPFNAPIAVNIGPLRLTPNTRYEWLVRIDGKKIASASFSTRP